MQGLKQFIRVRRVNLSECLIPPEILDDAFYDSIVLLSSMEWLTNVLEIGSSAGGGSTSAFVRGLMQNKSHPALYCLEISRSRFMELERTYRENGFVKCFNVSSVSSSRVATENDVREFYQAEKTTLNRYKLSAVLAWREEGLRYLHEHADLDQNGIQMIKRDNAIKVFDLVLIDGSEFTGMSELEDVYGSTIICLDDTNAFKCHAVRMRLMKDSNYELLADNQRLRNGFSIFCRTEAVGKLHTIQPTLEAMQLGVDNWKSGIRRSLRAIRRVFIQR